VAVGRATGGGSEGGGGNKSSPKKKYDSYGVTKKGTLLSSPKETNPLIYGRGARCYISPKRRKVGERRAWRGEKKKRHRAQVHKEKKSFDNSWGWGRERVQEGTLQLTF